MNCVYLQSLYLSFLWTNVQNSAQKTSQLASFMVKATQGLSYYPYRSSLSSRRIQPYCSRLTLFGRPLIKFEYYSRDLNFQVQDAPKLGLKLFKRAKRFVAADLKESFIIGNNLSVTEAQPIRADHIGTYSRAKTMGSVIAKILRP